MCYYINISVRHSNVKTSKIIKSNEFVTRKRNVGGDYMREFLKGLELDKETIDTIMAEYGKNIQGLKEQIDEYKNNEANYKTKIDELSSMSDDNQKIQEELNTLKQQIAEKEANEKAKKDDEMLTNNIMAAIGDRQFVNDYTKNAVINDIKAALRDNANGGKSAKDLFEELTENKSDIFANPNQLQDMAGMGDGEEETNKKEIPLMW